MTIERLPSGSYRITQMYKGKLYRKTVSFKPTQKEAVLIMAELLEEKEEKKDSGTVGMFLDKYLDSCRSRSRSLSPATIRGYGSIVRNISEGFKELRFFDVSEEDIRKELKRYEKTHSVKSTKNLKGFLNMVFAEYRPKFSFSYSFKTEEPRAEYEPTTDDIKRILDAVSGTEYEVPFRLGVLGLRRGEICALNSEDLNGNVLSINKAVVLNEENQIEIKEPKTQASKRRIRIPDSLAALIRERGFYKGSLQMLNKRLHSVQDSLSIPRFKFHMLRHFAVAYLHKEGFTTEQIMSYGGWSTDSVMRRAYRYNLNPEESQKAISDKFDSLM